MFPDWDEHWNLIAFNEIANLDAVISLVKGRDCVVQAGGNVGIFANHLAESFARVITLEPDNDNWECLRRNCTRRNITVYHAGLGDSIGFCHMTGNRTDSGALRTGEGGQIMQVTIDSLNLPACDLIYLDIEGAESNAINGALDTIARCRPVIVTEAKGLDPMYRGEQGRIKFHARMAEIGYTFHSRIGADDVFTP